MIRRIASNAPSLLLALVLGYLAVEAARTLGVPLWGRIAIAGAIGLAVSFTYPARKIEP